jgi:hypothetical protein
MKPGLQDVNQINEGTGVHWEAIICYGLAILFIITILTLITIWLLEYIEKRWNKHHDKEDDYDKHVKNGPKIRNKKHHIHSDYLSPSNKEEEHKGFYEEEKSPVIELDVPQISDEKEKRMQPKALVEDKKTTVSTYYFPQNKNSIFLKIFEEKNFQSFFEAKEIKPGIFEFNIISVDKIKAWDISDAVINVGTIRQQDAVSFITKEVGIAERRVESGTTYWLITQKAKIEFKK